MITKRRQEEREEGTQRKRRRTERLQGKAGTTGKSKPPSPYSSEINTKMGGIMVQAQTPYIHTYMTCIQTHKHTHTHMYIYLHMCAYPNRCITHHTAKGRTIYVEQQVVYCVHFV